MIQSEESWRAQQRLGLLAKAGKVRCEKCSKDLVSIFQICFCGGRATADYDGALMVSSERKHGTDGHTVSVLRDQAVGSPGAGSGGEAL